MDLFWAYPEAWPFLRVKKCHHQILRPKRFLQHASHDIHATFHFITLADLRHITLTGACWKEVGRACRVWWRNGDNRQVFGVERLHLASYLTWEQINMMHALLSLWCVCLCVLGGRPPTSWTIISLFYGRCQEINVFTGPPYHLPTHRTWQNLWSDI